MRRILSATSCLTPVALATLALPAHAATVTITGARTAGITTATVASGSTSDISISSSGSVTPTVSGAAVTIDSDNSVDNAGSITFTGVDDASGILANDGVTATITNSGTITVSESYTQSDSNGDGVVDGAFAEGSDRYGIRTLGAFTGDIANSGTITVKGNDSAGILLGGTLTGSLTQSGTITVTGDNSVGISGGAISGNVDITGSVSATGLNASAVVLDGNIGGRLTIQSALGSTGYTSTTLPSSTSSLGADNLLQNGPTLSIAGSVAGGVILTAATSTTDSSGSTVTTTASSITSYGTGAAVQIGSAANAISIGALSGNSNGYGFEMDGTITASGVYSGYATHGLVIGGLGGTVDIAGGVGITGAITATSNDASATAIEIGSGASVPVLDISSTVSATGAVDSGQTNTAVRIDAGASVPTVTNSGTLSASTSATTVNADNVAFVDKSGTVASFTNRGTITATGGVTNTALDFSASTAGVSVTQAAPSSGSTTPSITGDILFGSGNDTLTVSDGTVTGNVRFGAGTNSFALSGSSTFTGDADFGGSGSGALSIGSGSTFTGTLANTGGVALGVAGGTLTLTNTGTVALGSLSVTNGGTLGVTIDGSTGSATLYSVTGAASFDTGSKLALHFQDINYTAGTYAVVQAGSLSGTDNISVTSSALPYLFKTALSDNASAATLTLHVTRKTAGELGLNRNESAAYEPIFAAISGDKNLGDAFLNLTDAASFKSALRTLMPDYAGASFDSVTLASRASMNWLADPSAPVYQAGPWGLWIQQVGWLHSKAIDDTAGYRVAGWGMAGGGERSLGKFGRVGVSLAYLVGTTNDKDTANKVTNNQYEFGGYWRSDWGRLHAYARANYAFIRFKSTRSFTGSDDGTDFTRTAVGRWNGRLLSGAAGLSYSANFGAFSLRPQASIDYYRLSEGGYGDKGGGTGMDLIVDSRRSREFAASQALALGYRIYDDDANDGGYLRAELEGGRREVINGSLGATTAAFAGGDSFTLTPDARKGAWTGAFRLKGGNGDFTVSGEVDGERQQGTTALGLRVGLQMAL
ncbi:autotransporter outer membrane beta-barrel domain-containing protein [Flavisphingomonas formosensis]|uniref:autotransporter outer membrane beta-barrel domain-containing protein n=1 Tax=Flavisphingomonas formosensis TaxID=861534 RepID=UPI0012F70C05|nr:autotransporter outer membrane beta-barrel domain-containing protein [Sphingomonas formosensis]